MGSILAKRIKEDAKIEKGDIICDFPRKMLLELTNMCNDSCLFCANSKCTKERGIIDKDFAKRILREAYDLGMREVGFYGTGEPLLDKNLEEYISYAKQIGYEYTYITTNGALLTKERSETIIAAGIDSIKFSINASNKKEYQMIHGKDDFDRVIENLIYLDALRKKKNKELAVYISYVLTRYTYSHKDEFKKQYSQYVDDIVFVDCLNTGGYMSDEISSMLSMNGITKTYFEDDICPMIFRNLYITYEGYLTMCCSDFQNYLVVADLNKDSLADAWNNQYAQELRKRHLDHKLEGTICANCIYNCNEICYPLVKEYASMFDIQKYDKSAEIEERISNWQHDVEVKPESENANADTGNINDL